MCAGNYIGHKRPGVIKIVKMQVENLLGQVTFWVTCTMVQVAMKKYFNP